MGSVKDLIILKKPEANKTGEGIFEFSDRYSVFDWGEMPDHIEYKGVAINLLASYFFELIESKGIHTHYNGILYEDKLYNTLDNNIFNENNEKIKKDLNDLNLKKLNKMKVKLVNVYKPELKENFYDYSIYSKKNTNYLLPLEIIYRNKITENSSFLKRYKESRLNLNDFGLTDFPEINIKLKKPIIDFSTKLEITDRYISKDEAKKISNLNEKEMDKLIEILIFVNEIITEQFSKIGFENIDGKIEVAFDENREFMIVDVFGTLDECRFFYNDINISKEILRIYYRNTKWYNDVEEAKKIDRFNWKKIIKSTPEKLPQELKEAVSSIYCYVTNKITGIEIFKNINDFDYSIKTIKKWARNN